MVPQVTVRDLNVIWFRVIRKPLQTRKMTNGLFDIAKKLTRYGQGLASSCADKVHHQHHLHAAKVSTPAANIASRRARGRLESC